MLEPRPDWFPLGVKFKISDEHPRLFHKGVYPPPGVSYSVEKEYLDYFKSILTEIKREDIDITSYSANDEDELKILQTFALAFAKDEK